MVRQQRVKNRDQAFHILGIAGSLRRGSYNRRLLEAARELAPPGVEVEIFDLAPVPFYDGDVEAAGDPPAVRELKARIRAADALLIATPEYNGTVPGVLQNAIDWASRPRGASALDGKPVAILGASPGGGGTVRAQRILRQVLTNARAAVLPAPELHVARVGERLGEDGILRDERLGEELAGLLAALVDWAGERGEAAAQAA